MKRTPPILTLPSPTFSPPSSPPLPPNGGKRSRDGGGGASAQAQARARHQKARTDPKKAAADTELTDAIAAATMARFPDVTIQEPAKNFQRYGSQPGKRCIHATFAVGTADIDRVLASSGHGGVYFEPSFAGATVPHTNRYQTVWYPASHATRLSAWFAVIKNTPSGSVHCVTPRWHTTSASSSVVLMPR